MSESITISHKHGVNPTIPICFFCGKEKNEIALLGKLKDDVEAPRNILLDYEPCEECKKKMSIGVTLIGTTPNNTEELPPIGKDGDDNILYPTGEWVVITKDASKRYFNDVVTEEELDNHDIILVEQEFIDYLNEQNRKFEAEE